MVGAACLVANIMPKDNQDALIFTESVKTKNALFCKHRFSESVHEVTFFCSGRLG
jgi:hypothetical protein